MLRWDWRPACERRGGVWECVCTTVLWGRGLYNDFELFFFWERVQLLYSCLLDTQPEGCVCCDLRTRPSARLRYDLRRRGGWCLPVWHASDLRTLSAAVHEIAFRRTAFATARRAAACPLSHSLRCSEALSVVLAALEARPSLPLSSLFFSSTRTHTPRHHSGSGSHVCPQR